MKDISEIKQMTVWEKAGYGVCDMGGNLFFTAIGFWLLIYLTDVVGLVPKLAGMVLIISRFWDAVTDPAMGVISDRTNTRWGRRRPYIFIGSFPLFLSMAFLFTNPHIQNQTPLFIWAVISFCFLSTAYTVVNIPYSALTPELTSNYNEKTSLNGFRMSFAVLGTLVAAALAKPIIDAFPDKDSGFMMMGIVFGLVMMITALITFFSVKEKKRNTGENPIKMNVLQQYHSAFSNGPFLLILFPWILNITGLTILSGMLIYYFKYIYHAEDQVTTAMVLLIVTALIFIPVWVLISKKIGKKWSYITGLMILMTVLIIVFFFAEQGGIQFLYIMMFFSGIGLSTGYVFPWAIVPDAIEYDYLKTGERKEGVFYGLWTFSSKIGQAIAGGLMGFVLGTAGYQAGQIQSASAELAIRLLLGLIPAGIYFIAAVILFFYPISEKEYQKIMKKIDEKQPAE